MYQRMVGEDVTAVEQDFKGHHENNVERDRHPLDGRHDYWLYSGNFPICFWTSVHVGRYHLNTFVRLDAAAGDTGYVL